jgi:bla regulator protein BlaR1
MILATLSFSSSSFAALSAPIVNHLWQSTFFAAFAGLLTLLLRKNHARTRYALWLIASIKFLIPFSLLVLLGSHLGWSKTPAIPRSNFTFALQEISRPFTPLHPIPLAPAPSTFLVGPARLLPRLVMLVWLCGGATVLFFWSLRWRRMTAVIRSASPANSSRELEALRRVDQSIGISGRVRLIVSPSALEPGIVGIFRPILLLPEGISDRLTDTQLDSIITHELCHVRGRDNFAATLHMLVETLFWFHPLLWWIGSRLVDERERACDEAVLSLGSDPQVYAEGILKVCEFYLESPLFCAAGVTGSNLKKRIEAIMTHHTPKNLRLGKKLLLGATAATAVLVPFGFGVLHASQSGPDSQTPQIVTASFYNAPLLRAYEAVSIRPTKSIHNATPAAEFRPDGFTATNVTLQILIQQAYGVQAYQISGAPDWLNRDRYDLEAKLDDSLADELSKGDVNQLSAEQQPMLLELLADRFKLSVHRETRELPAYALVIGKNGSKLHEATPGDTYPNGLKDAMGNGHGEIVRWLRGQVIGQGISLEFLVHELSRELGRLVLDRTGLSGKYDFTLQWSDGRVLAREYIVVPGSSGTISKPMRVDPPASTNTQSAEFSDPSIFTALQDQLGLELLESNEQTAPAQVLVIDHAEPASAGNSSELQSQPALAFESASVKPNKTDTPMAGFNIKGKPFSAAMFKPDRFMATNFTLLQLVRMAYRVQDSQILGGPDWLKSEKYDLDAKIGGTVVEELSKLGPNQSALERGKMLQTLLADRFKLALHFDTRELRAYTLTVSDNGPKLQTAKPGDTYPNGPKRVGGLSAGPGLWESEHGRIVFQGRPISSLVQFLSDRLNRIVLDKTGLTDNYDFALQWTPIPPESSSPSILGAVHDQLGLKLQLQTSPVGVLVIDHAEQPSGN